MVFCSCGKVAIIRCSWTTQNRGRRFYACPDQGSSCRFIGWVDPAMCPRSVQIIPGLLRSKNRAEAELKVSRGVCTHYTFLLAKQMARADQYFCIQFEKHIRKNGRLTIPAEFVRMHGLWRYPRCLFLVDGFAHPLDLHVHGDKRRDLPFPEHVVVKGDFEGLKGLHKWSNKCWLKFTLDD